MSWTAPVASDFKAYFTRDFPYAPSGSPNDLEYITDADINRAIAEATGYFNPGLGYGDDTAINTAFFYLTAFFLAQNLQNSARGISAQAVFPQSSKSAGGVSTSFQIPEKIAKDPNLSFLTANAYGMKYLMLSTPLLVGGGASLVDGDTVWG